LRKSHYHVLSRLVKNETGPPGAPQLATLQHLEILEQVL